MRLWRNWHTRTFEGRVRQLVRVQVPLAASGGAKQNKNGSCFALFCVPDNNNPKPFSIEDGFEFF